MQNRPNQRYETTCGKVFWHSRSVAVAVTAFFTKISDPNNTFVPVVRRGPDSETEPGKFCLPCGYLDWDEDGAHGARRELREETGILIENYIRPPFNEVKSFPIFQCFYPYAGDEQAQPWMINSRPDMDNLQNITLYFGSHCIVEELPKVHRDFNEVKDEVTEIIWWNTKDLYIKHNHELKEIFAFNHEIRIRDFMRFLSRINK